MPAHDSTQFLRRLNAHSAKALEAAAGLAQTRAHAEISLEHWLVKFLEMGDGDIPAILGHYEIEMDPLWQALLGGLDRCPKNLRGKPGLSRPLADLLESAWLIASLEEGGGQIRSAHLLAALQDSPHFLKNPEAWPLLSFSRTQIERLKPKLDQISIESPGAESFSAVSTVAANTGEGEAVGPPSASATSARPEALTRFCQNVTEKAAQGRIDPVFGRDREIAQMIDILTRRRKNNPLLVGEPGVGKTALVEGLALKITKGETPASLRNVELLTLDLGLLSAGAGVKGEFEQRLKSVIEAVQSAKTPILLFIDEAHTIIGAGNQAGGADAANLLKPALARGELRTIAATTWSEYKQYFERDAALERRFQMVKVDEPDDETAFQMLRGLREKYAEHHGVHVRDEAVRAAVELSRRYISGRQLPDKAVDLLDTSAARVRMSLEVSPPPLAALEARLRGLKLEEAALVLDEERGHEHPDGRRAALAAEIAALEKEAEDLRTRKANEEARMERLRALRRELRKKGLDADIKARLAEEEAQGPDEPLAHEDVDAKVVAMVVADWTGIPMGRLMKDELQNLLNLETLLEERVVGQTAALALLADALRAAKAGLKAGDAPLGVFLLTGPSGVGKTETALALSDLLFGGERALITINLSEYQEAHTVSQLKGSPPGYAGYGQGGVLTEAVRQRPYSVVLLDEVEKAHPEVLNMFYQVFDRGLMRDGEGREIDFRNTVVIMTSNLGGPEMMALLEDEPEIGNAALMEHLSPILNSRFPAALLARFQTIPFRPLVRQAMEKIVGLKLAKIGGRLRAQYQAELAAAPELVSALAAGCLLPETGARNIDHLLNRQLMPAVSRALLSWRLAAAGFPKLVSLDRDENGGISVELS